MIASLINVDRSTIEYIIAYVADINHRRHFQDKSVAIIIIIIIIIRVLLSTHPSCSLEEDQSVEMFCFFRHLCFCIHLGPSINGLVTDGNTKLCCRGFILALFQSTTTNKINSEHTRDYKRLLPVCEAEILRVTVK